MLNLTKHTKQNLVCVFLSCSVLVLFVAELLAVTELMLLWNCWCCSYSYCAVHTQARSLNDSVIAGDMKAITAQLNCTGMICFISVFIAVILTKFFLWFRIMVSICVVCASPIWSFNCFCQCSLTLLILHNL